MTVEWVDLEPESGPDASRPTPRVGRRTRWSLALLALCLAVAAGFVAGRTTQPTQARKPTPAAAVVLPSAAVTPVSGVVLVRKYDVLAAGNGTAEFCLASGVYGDIRTGSPVLVTDVDQHFIGATRLDRGEFVNGACSFGFTLSVQVSGPLYEFQIGDRIGTVVQQAQLTHVVITYE